MFKGQRQMLVWHSKPRIARRQFGLKPWLSLGCFLFVFCSAPSGECRLNNECLQRRLSKLNQGKLSEAIAAFNQAITNDPRDWQSLYNRGIAESRLGQYQAAKADFTQSIQVNPHNSWTYYLGELFGRLFCAVIYRAVMVLTQNQ